MCTAGAPIARAAFSARLMLYMQSVSRSGRLMPMSHSTLIARMDGSSPYFSRFFLHPIAHSSVEGSSVQALLSNSMLTVFRPIFFAHARSSSP